MQVELDPCVCGCSGFSLAATSPMAESAAGQIAASEKGLLLSTTALIYILGTLPSPPVETPLPSSLSHRSDALASTGHHPRCWGFANHLLLLEIWFLILSSSCLFLLSSLLFFIFLPWLDILLLLPNLYRSHGYLVVALIHSRAKTLNPSINLYINPYHTIIAFTSLFDLELSIAVDIKALLDLCKKSNPNLDPNSM